MCEVWNSNHRFEATCEIHNPTTGYSFKIPFFPIYYNDSTGVIKPLGIPLERSIEVEGPLVFAGFGLTKQDDGWDDYARESIKGKVAVVIGSVPNEDHKRFPLEPYASSNYKVSNAVKHGAKAIVWVSDPFGEPSTQPPPVTYAEEISGIYIPTFIFDQFLGELQRGYSLLSLKREIEGKSEPKDPFPLNLDMRISFKGNEFRIEESEHFTYFLHTGSLAEQELAAIINARERAYKEISQKLGIDHKGKIKFFLFPSAREKAFYTGTIGWGWGTAQTIIEIYDSEIKLDPWHETTHIISCSINQDPPSLFFEGLAVYMIDIMREEGGTIDGLAVRFKGDNWLIPLGELIDLQIGSKRSNPTISYPESGSFVKYLVERYGMDLFKRLYAQIHKGQESTEKNQVIHRIYDKSIAELEKEWLDCITASVRDDNNRKDQL